MQLSGSKNMFVGVYENVIYIQFSEPQTTSFSSTYKNGWT